MRILEKSPNGVRVLPFSTIREFRLNIDAHMPEEVGRIPLPPSLHGAAPGRQLQFRAGRYCAMQAMNALGSHLSTREVGRTSTGAPIWPEGLVGSIAHTTDLAIAAVASADHVQGIGIDTEGIITESRARNVGRLVAWASEIGHGRGAGLTRLESLTLVFSAKESIFKCLHPMVGYYFDFHDVRIVAVGAASGTFAARLVRPLGEFPAQSVLEGRFEIEGQRIHTGIALQPGEGFGTALA